MNNHPFTGSEDHACFMVAYHLAEATKHFENTFEDLPTVQNSVAYYSLKYDLTGFSASAVAGFVEVMHALYPDD